jgi:ParB/RepB/Spo0J family partition protein
MNTEKILVEKIHLDPWQPREVYTEIPELAEGIKTAGFNENDPVILWTHKDLGEMIEMFSYENGELVVVDGHRRTKASKMAGLQEIPAFVHDLSHMPLEKARYWVWEQQLTGNAGRVDLAPMNRARVFEKSVRAVKDGGYGMSIGRVAAIHSVSVATVKADLELCGLAQELHKFVDDGKIPKDVARKIATSFESPQQQLHVFNNAVKDKKTSSAMLSAIQAYLDKQAQRDIFAQARKEAGENGGLSKARKASEKLEKIISDYEKNWAGDPNVINARKRDVAKLRLTFQAMKRIADKTLEQIQSFDAKTEINAPKAAVANG